MKVSTRAPLRRPVVWPTQRSRATHRLLGAVGAIGAVAITLTGVVQASQPKGKITPVRRSTQGSTQLARSISEGNKYFRSARFVIIPPDHDPVATSTKPLDGFPRHGKSFAILTTGCAHLANRPKSVLASCEDGGPLFRGSRETTIWRIHVSVPKGKNCLSFRFRFLSEEYPEYVGSEYNDAFIAELDQNDWEASSNTSPKIHAPHNFATTANGELVSVNKAGLARMSSANAKGTVYGGATRVLRASTPIGPGSHYLYLSILGQGDRLFDSAVFIDHLTLTHHSGSGCKSGLAATQ